MLRAGTAFDIEHLADEGLLAGRLNSRRSPISMGTKIERMEIRATLVIVHCTSSARAGLIGL